MQKQVDHSKDTFKNSQLAVFNTEYLSTLDLFCPYLKVYCKINEINLFVN